jgi:hypothetical protein
MEGNRLALRRGCSAHPAGIVSAAALVGALIEVHDLGWAATPIVAAFPPAAGAFAVPTAVERHPTQTMLELGHLRNPFFPGANAGASAINAGRLTPSSAQIAPEAR